MKQRLTGTALLEKLCAVFGPSGCESAVAEVIRENIDGLYDELLYDKLGGMIAVIHGIVGAASSSPIQPKKLMLSAHMDEVGFMISHVAENGMLRFATLSGTDTRVISARRVEVGNADLRVKGVVSAKPVHLLTKDERDSTAEYSSLYIDIGTKSREETEKYVRRGDYGTYLSDFVRFGQDGRMLKSKAIDDRLGCAVLCDVMAYFHDNSPPFDLCFAFTCREELGLSGARCAANIVKPDTAIIFEATATAPSGGDYRSVAIQGEGGAVSYIDRGTIYDRELSDFILACGRGRGIPCQIKQYVSGGNDAACIQRSIGGVRCAAVSAPARYIHTASNVIREDDFTNIIRLAEAAIDGMAVR